MCMCVNPGVPVPLEVRGIGYPGGRVTGSCWAPDTGAGNRTQVLCMCSVCTQPPSHFSSHPTSLQSKALEFSGPRN